MSEKPSIDSCAPFVYTQMEDSVFTAQLRNLISHRDSSNELFTISPAVRVDKYDWRLVV